MDTPTKPKMKKPPKWVIPAAAIVILGGYIIFKKKHNATGSSTEPGTEGLSNQSFIPVTGGGGIGEGGVGSPGVSPGYGENKENNNQLITEIISADRSTLVEQEQTNKHFQETLVEKLGTGGGATTVQAPPGVVAAPPQNGSSPSQAPPTVISQKTQPQRNPGYTITKSPQGCECHKYATHTECQHKDSSHRCVW